MLTLLGLTLMWGIISFCRVFIRMRKNHTSFPHELLEFGDIKFKIGNFVDYVGVVVSFVFTGLLIIVSIIKYLP